MQYLGPDITVQLHYFTKIIILSWMLIMIADHGGGRKNFSKKISTFFSKSHKDDMLQIWT
jgi:hypothetical protein